MAKHYTYIGLNPPIYKSLQTAVSTLKMREGRWSYGALINIAVKEFLSDFPYRDEDELRELFIDYKKGSNNVHESDKEKKQSANLPDGA